MGNKDGLIESLATRGTNQVKEFEHGYFSFAHGDEIALVLKSIPGEYFILNCDEALFDEVKNKVDEGLTEEEIKIFWTEKSKHYEISDWSSDFSELNK